MAMRFGIISMLLLLSFSARLWAADSVGTVGKLDAQFAAAWKVAGIGPAAEVDDARYLRRVYLDIAGTLPPPAKVREFLLDPSAEKRARVVNQLLESPEYATRWANYWNAVLMGRTIESAAIDQGGFKVWLREEFSKNERWDKIVTALLTAEGCNTNRKPMNARAHPSD